MVVLKKTMVFIIPDYSGKRCYHIVEIRLHHVCRTVDACLPWFSNHEDNSAATTSTSFCFLCMYMYTHKTQSCCLANDPAAATSHNLTIATVGGNTPEAQHKCAQCPRVLSSRQAGVFYTIADVPRRP